MTKKKKVWMRLGISLYLTEEELNEVKEQPNDNKIIRNKIANGDFEVDGDSYIPPTEGYEDEDVWPIEDSIDFTFYK